MQSNNPLSKSLIEAASRVMSGQPEPTNEPLNEGRIISKKDFNKEVQQLDKFIREWDKLGSQIMKMETEINSIADGLRVYSPWFKSEDDNNRNKFSDVFSSKGHPLARSLDKIGRAQDTIETKLKAFQKNAQEAKSKGVF